MGFGVGLIGTGAIASLHLEALKASPHVDFVALAEPNSDLLSERKAQYGEFIRTTTTDYTDLLQRDDLPVMDITVPHFLHYHTALDCLSANKHVIMEKPITLDVQEGKTLCQEAHSRKLRFYVSMNQRLMPGHKKAGELLDSGELGKPFLGLFNLMGYDPRMTDPDSWKGDVQKAGGGGLIDTGFHGTYLLWGFLGPIKSVQCSTKRTLSDLPQKGDDVAICIFEHANGALSELAVSYAVKSDPWEERRDIYCTEGSLHITDDVEHPLVIGRNGQRESVPGLEAAEGTFGYSVKRSIALALAAIAEDKPFVSEPEEAVEVLNVLRTAYEAAALQRKLEVPDI